jgi:hypothetical protein
LPCFDPILRDRDIRLDCIHHCTHPVFPSLHTKRPCACKGKRGRNDRIPIPPQWRTWKPLRYTLCIAAMPAAPSAVGM